MKAFFSTMVLSFWFAVTFAKAANPDDVLGIWYNEEKTAKIEVYKDGDRYYGKIMWLKEPTYVQKDVDENDHPLVKLGATKVDFKNSDESKQTTPILGLVILRGVKYDPDDEEWNDGRIYDPKKGSDYKCFIKMKSADRLDLRGYIGISLLGRTSYWTRAS